MPKISSLALGLGTILIVNFLSPSCSDSKKANSVAKDAAQILGDVGETGGNTSSGSCL